MLQRSPAVLRLSVQPAPLRISSSLCAVNVLSFPVCAALSCSLPWSMAPAAPGEQEHHAGDPPGMPSVEPGLKGSRAGSGAAAVVLRVSSEPRANGQCSLSASYFQSPFSGTQRLSVPLPPPSAPQRSSASLGWISSTPKQLLLRRQHCSCPYQSCQLAALRPGMELAATPSSSKTHYLVPLWGVLCLPLPPKRLRGSASLGCGAKSLIWLQVRIAQLILAGKRICFSPNNSKEAFSSVPLTLRKSSRLAQPRSGAFLGFSFPFAASVALPGVKRFGKAAGGTGKVQ